MIARQIRSTGWRQTRGSIWTGSATCWRSGPRCRGRGAGRRRNRTGTSTFPTTSVRSQPWEVAEPSYRPPDPRASSGVHGSRPIPVHALTGMNGAGMTLVGAEGACTSPVLRHMRTAMGVGKPLPTFRHPGAARSRSGRAGPGRDPCTSALALASDNAPALPPLTNGVVHHGVSGQDSGRW